ncbi:hypothetical protein Tco_0250063, partial [Tanacetum coccineum]
MKNPRMKETEDNIKEGTLQVDQGTDVMTLVLESQLDAVRREREEKELLIKSMSSKMSQTEGMVTKLKNQLAAQGLCSYLGQISNIVQGPRFEISVIA